MEVKRIAVVGAGTMGMGIAHVAGRSGFDVSLNDISSGALERARGLIEKNLTREVQREKISEADRDAALDRIVLSSDLSESVEGADLVVEAVSERTELKRDIFRGIDAAASPEAILASNTSSISITEIAGWTSQPHRVIGMHFMNPVPMMRLVEVIRGLETDDVTGAQVMEVARAMGKTPVEVNDYPGFVSNRVLMPMINEAVFCLMEGVGTAPAIDEVMTLGMNHPLGPLALADLIGLDICLDILEVLHRELGDDRYRPCPLLRKYVAAGWLGRKSGRGFHMYDG